MRRRWPEVRAGLIAIAIGFGLVDGCPLPPKSETPGWERGLVESLRAVRDAVETPVAWIVPTLRVSQRWALYQAPGGPRFRIVIDGRTPDGAWQILYRAADAEHDEDAAVMESALVWGAYDPTDRPPDQYRDFCIWITARALARHPELAAVRVRQERIALGRGGFASSGDFAFEFVRGRR